MIQLWFNYDLGIVVSQHYSCDALINLVCDFGEGPAAAILMARLIGALFRYQKGGFHPAKSGNFRFHQQKCRFTVWLFHIAMDNNPCIDVFDMISPLNMAILHGYVE